MLSGADDETADPLFASISHLFGDHDLTTGNKSALLRALAGSTLNQTYL